IMFRFADADRLPPLSQFLPDPDEIEERIVSQLGSSALFASQFRENAARALLLPRRRPGARTPLWTQRLRAQNLQAVASAFADFPIMLETYRSCLQDVFDVPGLIELMKGIRSRAIGVDDVETPSASPFARSLVFAYTATYLYQLDMPVAERRSQALSLDRHMLRELLGAEALRELLDIEIIDSVEARLQSLDPETRARHGDGLHDLLRRIGDLSDAELLVRFEGDESALEASMNTLLAARRVARIELAGETRTIAAEDAALYRDALGVAEPMNLPAAFLETPTTPLEQLLMRFARNHSAFATPQMASRFGLLPAQIEPILTALAGQGKLIAGEFDPRGQGREWCEPDVLRRIKRGTLNRLRDEISPVAAAVLGRFLLDWHGVGHSGGVSRRGASRLDEIIDRLEGLPLSFAELERSILPARLPGFEPAMLDAMGALGQIVWVGQGAIGERDGRVALYRRDRIAMLFDPPADADSDTKAGEKELSPIQRAIVGHLEDRGASFFGELVQAIGGEAGDELFAGLWALVWRGLVTNDTFAPLRALASRPPPHRRRGRRAPASATSGRWSLVAPLLAHPQSATERLHARTLLFLERHGVLSREAMNLETQLGRFGAIYPVLREMEEAGRIRRGNFVEGMTSAQFAVPGAVDRLRALRGPSERPDAVLLAALDPAQPYGSQLEWPQTRRKQGRPRRAVGAGVVLIDGTPCLFIDGGGQRVLSFEEPARNAASGRLDAALRALAAGAGLLGLKRIH
ncbi:MAG: DEAD/DEAH box helicase, partial [Myxococcota bacterium]